MNKLFTALLSWAHRKHSHTLRKIKASYPRPKADPFEIISGYVRKHGGYIQFHYNPSKAKWQMRITDVHRKEKARGWGITLREAVEDMAATIVEVHRLAISRKEFNDALIEEAEKK